MLIWAYFVIAAYFWSDNEYYYGGAYNRIIKDEIYFWNLKFAEILFKFQIL